MIKLKHGKPADNRSECGRSSFERKTGILNTEWQFGLRREIIQVHKSKIYWTQEVNNFYLPGRIIFLDSREQDNYILQQTDSDTSIEFLWTLGAD